ncbi:MAG: zinc-finger domain-containing protein [Geminicoccales bacterium]
MPSSIGPGRSKGIDCPELLSRQDPVRPVRNAALGRFSSSRPETITGLGPTFENNHGVPEIRLNVREFSCIGASPPQGHPHGYINMSEQGMALCPYCATWYRYDPGNVPFESDPQINLLIETSV